ncbi:MAG TPA: Gfo/Idh/MocA family oxidoreductase [Chthoniobacteraceae bacterium]|nr:Gfo/Idh/MocA family oxidoreductase [Chthoniobacteraceae bacterium]
MKQTRVGIVGCGKMGRDHLRDLLAVEGCDAVVWDLHPETAREAAAATGATVARTFEELLLERGLDAIIIATPNRFHASMAIAALEAGKHVFLEKPMALHADDARRLARAARASGRHLCIGFELRQSLFPLEVKRLIGNGELGKLVSAQVMEYRGHFWPQWKGDRDDGGSMYLMELCHFIDLFRWWNEDEVETIHAVGSRRNIVGHYDYPDTQFNTFVFRNGFVGHIVSCHVRSAMPADFDKIYQPEFGHQYEYSVVGEKGSLHFLPLQGLCHIYRHERQPDGALYQRMHRTLDYTRFKSHHPTIHNTTDAIANFIASVRGEREPSLLPEDALRTHLTCYAAEEALASGRPVHLDEADLQAEPLPALVEV